MRGKNQSLSEDSHWWTHDAWLGNLPCEQIERIDERNWSEMDEVLTN